jgi:hypothetical protein
MADTRRILKRTTKLCMVCAFENGQRVTDVHKHQLCYDCWQNPHPRAKPNKSKSADKSKSTETEADKNTDTIGACVNRRTDGVCRTCLLPAAEHPDMTVYGKACDLEPYRVGLLTAFRHHHQEVERVAGKLFADVKTFVDYIGDTSRSLPLFLHFARKFSL